MRIGLTVLGAAILALLAWLLFLRPDPAPLASADAPPLRVQDDTAAAVADTPIPGFDIVRIDSNGVTVAAGRADPGTRVVLRLNGAEIGAADADANGEWSLVLTDPLPAGSGELTLDMVRADGTVVTSSQTVVVNVPESGAPLIVLGQPGQPSRVLQAPGEGVSAGPLSLSSVDYGESGAVILAGRATPGARVRVLANGREIGQATADARGEWSLSVDAGLPVGVHDLQIDMIENGAVTAVVSLPFERAAAGVAAGEVVVQPGASLWRIARSVYGAGPRYTVIYEANAAQIRDPDLIYPGQVFAVPGE